MISDKINTEIDFEERFFNDYFPWYWSPKTTKNGFPYLSHIVIHKHDPDKIYSTVWNDFKPILIDLLKRNNLKLQKVLRCNVNLSTHWGTYSEVTEPHVDHEIPHYNCLVYINDISEKGETYIFEETYKENEPSPTEVTVLHKVKPEKNKAIIFNGLNYHGTGQISPAEWRCVIVTTFTATPA